MAKIFISYRREDAGYPAQGIYDKLVDHFGKASVVFDVDTIPFGLDFRDYLNREVSKCDILLAVIGDRWVEKLKERLNEPKDFVRIEIQAALQRKIPVVPVLVEKASVPSEKDLPRELVDLVYRNATEVRAGSDYQFHLNRLINGLDYLLKNLQSDEELKAGPQKTTPKSEQKAKPSKPKPAEIQKIFTNGIGMEFVIIPEGDFMMGGDVGDYNKTPSHPVKISSPFYSNIENHTLRVWSEFNGSAS